MSDRYRLHLFLHGCGVIVLAMLAGVALSLAIPGAWGEDAVRAWRLAHLGPVVTGVWLIALAGSCQLLRLSSAASAACVWSLAASGYSFAISAVLAALCGVRGLEPTGPVANLVVFAGFTVGAVGGVIGLGVLLLGAWAALRKSEDRPVER